MPKRLTVPAFAIAATTLLPLHAQSTPATPQPDSTQQQTTPASQAPASQPSVPATSGVQPSPAMPASMPAQPQVKIQPARPGKSNTAYPAIPTPAPEDKSALPSFGPYRGNDTQVPQIATPTPVGKPVVVPQPITPAAPIEALPAYAPDKHRHSEPEPVVPRPEKPGELHERKPYGSAYIPMDSWVYPAVSRLYSLGFVDTMFLGMRPYTRQSLLHMLDASESAIADSDSTEAQEILDKLMRELRSELPPNGGDRGLVLGTESVYTRVMGISGQTLRDSYHLGQTINNDYGRPYQPGFNNITGFSVLAEKGRFSFYYRGEYQHAPSNAGYSYSLASQLSQGIPYTQDAGDGIPFTGGNLHQDTIPYGPLPSQNPLRVVEATVSFYLAGHEISAGKGDAWLGPGQGGAMAWSNNAEGIYSFRINRVEPLHIPLLSRLLGPMRYDFFYGSLKGHTAPNDDWTHSEIASFRPTSNFEFAFQRTVVFGGKGHEPVTIHNFLKGFFDVSDTTLAEKYSRTDPGARFSVFTASYRLPLMRKYATFYVDSFAHDDVSPISAPRRAAYRTGLYISQIPGMRKLDLRVEAANTDPKVSRSSGGYFFFYEGVQQQAYTNKGYILGDWMGREGKGGQAWLTYHLSGNEWLQLEYLNKKNDKDFIYGAPLYANVLAAPPGAALFGPGGTTQNSFKVQAVKRFLNNNLEANAWFQYESWKAQAYRPGPQSDTVTAVQLTFFPRLKTNR